jgi:hypothetical protein
MLQFLFSLIFVVLLFTVLKWIGIAIYVIFIYVILPVVALSIAFVIARAIYHRFNPIAKKEYLERKAREAEGERLTREYAATAALKSKEQEAAAGLEREKRVEEEARRIKQTEKDEELARQWHRDSDQQDWPYTYQIGKHGNESLAIRYGIANQEKKVKEYWYPVQGGEMIRNPDRDSFYYEDRSTIKLRKARKVGKDLYEVLLTDYRDRPAKALIETGTEYVKTFYPLDDSWFKKHEELELTLKGNNSFTLKELATFHVQKIISNGHSK